MVRAAESIWPAIAAQAAADIGIVLVAAAPNAGILP
jgi:hypothetical protein